jgi:hypothetical protein
MKLIYELELEDYIKFCKYHSFVRNAKTDYLAYLLFFVIAMLSDHKNGFIKAVILCLAYIISVRLIVIHSAKKLYKTDKDCFGCHVATIKDDGLVIKNNNGEHIVYWEGIREVIVSNKHIFVYCGGNVSYVIPFKGSEQRREEFMTELSYHKYIKKVSPRTAQ